MLSTSARVAAWCRSIPAPTSTCSSPIRSSRWDACTCRSSARPRRRRGESSSIPRSSIIGERKASDDNSLQGTKEIDWAFEAGVGGGFRYDWFRAYATIRQGFNGYSGQTGEIGADVILPIGPRFEVAFGPRTSWGSDGYMETYFGVTPSEASKGILTAYKADAGFKTAGLAATANYWLTDKTRLQVRGSWNRLIGDAGDSPIVKYGSRDQWMVGIGISHKFSFDVFR